MYSRYIRRLEISWHDIEGTKSDPLISVLMVWPHTVLYSLCLPLSMSPPNPYAEILTPNVMVWGCGAFGRWLGREGGILARTQLCWHPDVRLPESRTTKNKFFLFINHPVYGPEIQWPRLTKANTMSVSASSSSSGTQFQSHFVPHLSHLSPSPSYQHQWILSRFK